MDANFSPIYGSFFNEEKLKKNERNSIICSSNHIPLQMFSHW